MSSLVFTERALEDLDRLVRFLRDTDPDTADATAGLVMDALGILEDHPLIGREWEAAFRELVISRGETGYIALYKYEADKDLVIVHAIRHQREVGFQP